jgi:zinc protease
MTCLSALSISVSAQISKEDEDKMTEMASRKLNIDSAVHYGILDNGLTYYIRHNEKPKQRAEFYIVQNTGSMQEEENQRGLAHFLEHIAFHGSKHFPTNNGIKDYCESKGMTFGKNLNAYTSFEETVYSLMNVPVNEKGIIDSCLTILYDWSSCLLIRDEDIEKERGVIREEWRTSTGAQMRLFKQQLPKMYPNSKYGYRLPIGDTAIINNFARNELVDYYRKWYRPDLQAIIIVGDIDAAMIEKKVKELFSDIPKPTEPSEKTLYSVPDNDIPLISIAKDKEMTNTTVSLYYKHETTPLALKGTLIDLLRRYNRTVISMIMNERFGDILQKPDAPFAAASAGDAAYFIARTKDAWTAQAIIKEGKSDAAVKALVAETERVKRFGFTEAEYERARNNILKHYESTYKERNNIENSDFAEEYITHFTEGDAIPGIEMEYNIIRNLASNIPLEAINLFAKHLFKESEKLNNIVISLTGPDKDGAEYPTERKLLELFSEASLASVAAKEDENIDRQLIATPPTPGKIVDERTDTLFGGVTLYTLNNGVRVAIKKTNFKEDQIMMTATSPGGLTLYPEEKDIYNKKVVNQSILAGGLGEFSATELRKRLAGTNIKLSAGIGESNENLNGSASPSDLKTFFELIYLQFTAVRADDEAYNAWQERIKSQLQNQILNPMIIFGDSLTNALYDGNPRNARMKASDFDKVDYHRTLEIYRERYADASDFLFTFVGNIETDSIRPLIEQYLGALPSLKRIEKGDESKVTPFHKGVVDNHFSRKLETPKTTVGLLYSGIMSYNLRENVTAQLLSNILDLTYMIKVREDESASYGVQSSVALYDFPLGRTTIQIFFDTDPAKSKTIINIVKTELENIAAKGPDADLLQKSVRSILKGREEIMQDNGYWLQIIDTYYYRAYDPHTDFNATIQSITPNDIRTFARKFLDQGNKIEVVMSPDN